MSAPLPPFSSDAAMQELDAVSWEDPIVMAHLRAYRSGKWETREELFFRLALFACKSNRAMVEQTVNILRNSPQPGTPL